MPPTGHLSAVIAALSSIAAADLLTPKLGIYYEAHTMLGPVGQDWHRREHPFLEQFFE